METKRSIQLKNNALLGLKVKIIYELICNSDIMELVELLSDQNLLQHKPNYREHRKKALSAILKKKSASRPYMQKEYPAYKLAQLYMRDEPAFPKRFFFDSDISTFRKRVEEYIVYLQKESLDFDLSYRYIYLFNHSESEEDNHNVNNLIYYKVEYAEISSLTFHDGFPIKVYPSKSKLHCGEYRGIIKKRENQIILMFENRYDSVHIIFNSSLASSSVNPIFHESYYGLAIGISDENKQTPVAKKVVFSKKKFTLQEKEQLYLILNETQRMEAKENVYALEKNTTLNADHLKKYAQKIKDIHTFFSNVKYSKAIDTNIMHHMIFTEFHVFHKMFEKFSCQQDYFLRDRKRICLEFIRFLDAHPNESVKMVLPLSSDEDNIFTVKVPGKKSLKTLFSELACKGMQIEMVFIVEKPSDYQTPQIKEVFKELSQAGVAIYFAAKKSIENQVSSYDFCYTKNGTDAIYRSHRRYKEMFTITQNREQIKNLMIDFERIKTQSYTLEEIAKENCVVGVENSVLQKLVGKWYLYFYGSYPYHDATPQFWQIPIEIKADHVIEIDKDGSMQRGTVTIYPKQTLLSLVSIQTENTHHIVLNNSKISDIIIVMIYSKQKQKDLDMAMIGIASRKILKKEDAMKLLGDPEKVVLKVDPMMQNKIDDFILHH
jgi:hypothetical protein